MCTESSGCKAPFNPVTSAYWTEGNFLFSFTTSLMPVVSVARKTGLGCPPKWIARRRGCAMWVEQDSLLSCGAG